MKKLFYLVIGAVMLSSCEKDPDMNQLDSDFTVYTQYDEVADFSSASTYYLPDSILTIGDGMKAIYWKDDNAQSLLAQVASEMNLRGYQRSEKKESADLGIQLTYVETNTQVTGWVGGGWGWDSWWSPSFWGPYWGGGWYYPYPVSYSYSTGTMVMEMVDLRNAPVDETTQTQLPVIWQAVSSGLLSSSNHFNLQLVERAIDQSFTQSPYIQNNVNNK